MYFVFQIHFVNMYSVFEKYIPSVFILNATATYKKHVKYFLETIV